MNKHKNILESLLKGLPEDTEVKSLLINNMLLLDIMFKKYPELKSVAVDLFCSYEVPRKTTGKIEKLEMQEISHGGENMVLHIQKIPATAEEMHDKINELVNYVNALIESNNIHEKQIDKLQMKLEPEKCAVNELKGAKNE